VFLAYFVGTERLGLWMTSSPAAHPTGFAVLLVTSGLIYADFGFFREQMCTVACPYARLQSVLLDPKSIVVGYDVQRGEPRGRGAGYGDCVDCGACVTTCPTGIDIREGLQIECIACANCIDACDGVMDKMGYPRGLIRYTTENVIAGRPRRIVRPRTAIYAVLLAFLLSAFAWGVMHRAPVIVDVLHDRNALYRETGDGAIENGYTMKLVNKTDHAQRLRIDVERDSGLRIVGKTAVDVGAGEVANIPLTLRDEHEAHERRRRVELHVRNADGTIAIEHHTEFFAPEHEHEHDHD
jgi:cytochrome c oxidase accessory protein FixG